MNLSDTIAMLRKEKKKAWKSQYRVAFECILSLHLQLTYSVSPSLYCSFIPLLFLVNRSVQPLLERIGMRTAVAEILQAAAPESFFALNLRSILLNLAA